MTASGVSAIDFAWHELHDKNFTLDVAVILRGRRGERREERGGGEGGRVRGGG